MSAVSIVDIASGTVLKTIKIGGQPEGVRVDPDGKRVFITSEEDGTIAVLDLAAGHIISTFKVGIVRARSRSCLTVLVPTSTPKMTGRSLWWTP